MGSNTICCKSMTCTMCVHFLNNIKSFYRYLYYKDVECLHIPHSVCPLYDGSKRIRLFRYHRERINHDLIMLKVKSMLPCTILKLKYRQSNKFTLNPESVDIITFNKCDTNTGTKSMVISCPHATPVLVYIVYEKQKMYNVFSWFKSKTINESIHTFIIRYDNIRPNFLGLNV